MSQKPIKKTSRPQFMISQSHSAEPCLEDNAVQRQRKLGAVYTPSKLADWVARLFIEMGSLPENSLICDPACGDGELLHSVMLHQPSVVALGLDVDPSATLQAAERLGTAAKIYTRDALKNPFKVCIPTWATGLNSASLDGVIANPPWGAELTASREELHSIGYKLARGQFDSWDLFIEASLRNLAPYGIAAFIIPDSLFLPEHSRTREILHTSTTIRFVARLGEGFFPRVFRGTTVVLFENINPSPDHEIETLRFNKQDRRSIFSGDAEFDEIRREKSIRIPQSRFQKDHYGRWDVDSKTSEDHSIQNFSAARSSWTDWLVSGRGVELSKSGRVLICPSCSFTRPATKQKHLSCGNCGFSAPAHEFHAEQIISEVPNADGTFPLLVGEDVKRYFAAPSRYIKTGMPGINYKSLEVYSRRRLLIRKTGVGIKASIVDEPCMTNQVVFHYYPNPNANPPEFFLSYCLGVLCSRTLLAYHLRTTGDNEWRSHPYVTQKVISGLPIPMPEEGSRSWGQAKAIAASVDRMTKGSMPATEADIEIESLVSALFGFNETSYSWVEHVLEQAEALEPIRTLRLGEGLRVAPRWVA
ncbi:N-6 DNA methylase [Roseovarius sp. THAF9]|uniref:N-6 DNA methylase n=1 Tax=Roseovarius sp. THAF9 TaxID=2587847 RepID=UPI0012684FBE